MFRRAYQYHATYSPFRYLFTEAVLALVLVIFSLAAPVSAGTRFQERSLYMNSTVASAVTDYTISLRYMSPDPVGSLDMLVCESPIFYDPCVVPPGFDASQAVLESQTGETGFTLSLVNQNHLRLSRTAVAPAPGQMASYKFSGITNPSNGDKALSIRLRSYTSTDASGPQIDFGGVRGQVTTPIQLETQVPPMLIFCMAQSVDDNCTATDEVYYNDLGTLSPDSTLSAQSQMAVGTNASQGFTITVNGAPPSAGSNQIPGAATPTASQMGRNQFGINLVANTLPDVGLSPSGPFTNAVPALMYSQPNLYTYNSGDVVAYSPDVSLMRKFTVSYILNSSADLRPGVYSTTITFIASGRF